MVVCSSLQKKGLLLQTAHDITVLTQTLENIDFEISGKLTLFINNINFNSQEDALYASALLQDYHGQVNILRKLLCDYRTEIMRASQLMQQ